MDQQLTLEILNTLKAVQENLQSNSLQLKDILSLIISGIGVVVSGWIGFLALKAAQESSKAANASLRLAEQMDKRIKREREAIREQYKFVIRQNTQDMHEFLWNLYNKRSDVTKTRNMASRSHGIAQDQLAIYFNPDECSQINEAWESFYNYIKKYWMANGEVGNFVHRLSGEAEHELDKLILKVEKFIEMLN